MCSHKYIVHIQFKTKMLDTHIFNPLYCLKQKILVSLELASVPVLARHLVLRVPSLSTFHNRPVATPGQHTQDFWRAVLLVLCLMVISHKLSAQAKKTDSFYWWWWIALKLVLRRIGISSLVFFPLKWFFSGSMPLDLFHFSLRSLFTQELNTRLPQYSLLFTNSFIVS